MAGRDGTLVATDERSLLTSMRRTARTPNIIIFEQQRVRRRICVRLCCATWLIRNKELYCLAVWHGERKDRECHRLI
jgi:hypothetical protein